MCPKIARTTAVCAVLLPLLSPAPAATAQDGRWRVLIEEGAGRLNGDLRLTAAGGRLRGTILLETSDTAPVAITDGTIEGDRFEFRLPPPQTWRFVGRVAGGHLRGEVLGGQPRPRRWTGWPLEDSAEFYPALPRFRLRQILTGPLREEATLPAAWVAAAERAGETPARLLDEYRRLARRAGLAPLEPAALRTLGLTHAMGLYRRGEVRAAALAALGEIREGLSTEQARTRFDRIFRSRDGWLVDIHDVALSRAGHRLARVSWDSARPALARAGLLPDAPEGVDAVPLALYRLATLAATDSAGFTATIAGLGEGPPAAAVSALLSGYAEASAWYEECLRFLLEERWIPDSGGGRRSPADAVARAWGAGAAGLVPPRIRAHRFGYPEGAPRPAVPADAVPSLVEPVNWSARAWLDRHGPLELLRVVRRIEPGLAEHTAVELEGRWLRVTSVARRAQASFTGFLEPEDEIWVDPSYLPLWALGSVVHEWQHVLHEGRRLGSGAALRISGEVVTQVPADAHLAEGLAEWETDRVLRDAVARWPLVGVGEAEKRATLALATPQDPHVLGYFLVRVLAEVRTPEAVRDLLVRHGAGAPEAFQAAGLDAAWPAATAGAGDVRIPIRGERSLVPETVFTIEDAVPDALVVRIRTGDGPKEER